MLLFLRITDNRLKYLIDSGNRSPAITASYIMGLKQLNGIWSILLPHVSWVRSFPHNCTAQNSKRIETFMGNIGNVAQRIPLQFSDSERYYQTSYVAVSVWFPIL